MSEELRITIDKLLDLLEALECDYDWMLSIDFELKGFLAEVEDDEEC